MSQFLSEETNSEKFLLLQAIGIIDEVGDLLQLKYSRLKPPAFTEHEIELLVDLKVTKNILVT